MKNIILLWIMFVVFSCKAQQTLPLNESDYGVTNYTYFKDINNELDDYIGVWKSNYQTNTITLIINKEIKREYGYGVKKFYKDMLIIRYEVKNSSGQIIQSTLNNAYNVGDDVSNLIMSLGTNLNSTNEVNLLYAGGNCSVGLGDVLFKKIDNTHFSWSYSPGNTVRDDITCPPNLDYKVYIPKAENLVFTKQ